MQSETTKPMKHKAKEVLDFYTATAMPGIPVLTWMPYVVSDIYVEQQVSPLNK